MKRNLGAFTCYGIEYVLDYLGEEKVQQKIKELKEANRPYMGVSLEDFTYRDAQSSYFGGKGILWVFDLLIQWFDDFEFVQYLFESSKRYNEDNYHDGGLLDEKWSDYVEFQNRMIKTTLTDNANNTVIKLNPYWMELHFFYRKVSQPWFVSSRNTGTLSNIVTWRYVPLLRYLLYY